MQYPWYHLKSRKTREREKRGKPGQRLREDRRKEREEVHMVGGGKIPQVTNVKNKIKFKAKT